MKSEVESDVWVKSICRMCYGECGINVHKVNGVVVKVEGDPDCPQNYGKLCGKAHAGMMSLYSPDRVKVPLKRTNPEKGIGVDPKWVEISLEEALDTVTQKLRKIREDDPRKLAMMTFDEEVLSVAFYPFAEAFGTPNAWCGSAEYFCGNSVHLMSYLAQGTFVVDPDLEYCNYLICIGAQPGFVSEPEAVITQTEMAKARTRRMKVVVVDPVMGGAAAKADEWLPIRPGTDGALALAMLNVLLNEVGLYDTEFIKKYTNGSYLIGPDEYYLRDKATNKPLIWDPVDGKAKTYDDTGTKDVALEGECEVNGTIGYPAFQVLKEHVKKYTCEEMAKITTIPAETIRRIAKEYGEAARIGSKIVVRGKELPYRPVAVAYKKGVSQHKHAALGTFAIHLLNIIVGNLDVPGGILGSCSTMLPNDVCHWRFGPTEGPDGMMEQGQRAKFPMYPDPSREIKPPETAQLLELFPVGCYSEAMVPLVVMNPEKFKFPYRVEALLHCRSNIMMSSVNPEQVAAWLKEIPFIASLAFQIDETLEFADIIIPDAHYLERLDMFPNNEMLFQKPGLGDWVFGVRQPVVEPPPGVRHWAESLLEIADRAGFSSNLNEHFSVFLELEDPYKLDLDKKYNWEEISDRWAKSAFGPEHDLAWFKEHGFIKWPRQVEEVYPRVFIKPRTPIYVEHWKRAGEELKKVTEEMGIPWWDVSDYQPLPDWKPCPAYEEHSPGYDLYPVPYKLPFHTQGWSADNIWLNELGEYHPYAYYIRINSQTARKKGIEDGDMVCLETETGKRVKGRVRLTESVHPEVLGIAGIFGHWAKGLPIAKGKGVHFNTLIMDDLEHMDMLCAAVDTCVKVKVSKVSEV